MNGDNPLKHFLSKGYVTKRDRILIHLIPFYGIIIANRVFSTIEKRHNESPTSLVSSTISIYQGKNTAAKKIQSQLQATPNAAIIAALVHGSIGDLNEIDYSDFDGILLIDNKSISNANQLLKLRQLIQKTELIFFEQDALQHHGWAIFTNSDLLQFNDHLFPFDLIRKSSCLYPQKELVIETNINSESDQYKILLKRLCASILHKTNHPSTLKNQYTFKNLLSEIMLLPSAFLQAKFHKTIQKQDSYVIFENEFPNIDATILNWSSEIRLKWKQDKITFKTKLFHRFKDRGIPLSFLAPKTPLSVYEQLNENWRQQVHKLCDTLLKNVG